MDTLCAKFTSKEIASIKKYKQRHNIKENNRVLRKAVELLLGLNTIDNPYPQCLNLLLQIVKEYREELKPNASDLRRFDEFTPELLRRLANKETEIFKNRVNMVATDWNAFREYRQRGRPKVPKRKRGRPRE